MVDVNKDWEVKFKVFQLIVDWIEKIYGKGLIMCFGDDNVIEVDVIFFGFLSFDIVFGVNGFFCGCIVEIYGLEFFGKIILVIYVFVECQKQGGIVVFIDVEYVFDCIYVKVLGVDMENLFIVQLDNGEQVLEIVENFICLGVIDIIVVDFVVALVFCSEIEGEMGDFKMGFQVRLMFQAMCKFIGMIGCMGCCCIFINQFWEKIGVMFGNFEIIIGGNVLKFYVFM